MGTPPGAIVPSHRIALPSCIYSIALGKEEKGYYPSLEALPATNDKQRGREDCDPNEREEWGGASWLGGGPALGDCHGQALCRVRGGARDSRLRREEKRQKRAGRLGPV